MCGPQVRFCERGSGRPESLLDPQGRTRKTDPGPGGRGQADAAPVQRRVSAANPGGGGALHAARRGGSAASPRGVVQLASDGSGARRAARARCGSWPRRSVARNRPNAIRWMRRCARWRRKWLVCGTKLHTAHTILDVQGKVAGLVCFNSPANHSTPERRLGGGADRRRAGVPGAGRVAGDLLPSPEVNSRAPAAPSNARPGAV